MLNHPIQGACADGYKLAAAMVWERRGESKGNPLLVNMIHDELIVEVDAAAAETDAALLEAIMLEGMRVALGADAPLRVDKAT
jgi:DNA polymerase I-like protein with 3'-5' exonuclease and polymerase domains